MGKSQETELLDLETKRISNFLYIFSISSEQKLYTFGLVLIKYFILRISGKSFLGILKET